MIGQQLPQDSLFSYQVNLEKRVPPDHSLPRVNQVVDFSFGRAAVAHCYGHNGNESVAPEVILKMIFLLFFEDIASERELMRTLPVRLDYLCFLGYGLDDPTPDHSVLSKARRSTNWPISRGCLPSDQPFRKSLAILQGQAWLILMYPDSMTNFPALPCSSLIASSTLWGGLN
jgi:transposase